MAIDVADHSTSGRLPVASSRVVIVMPCAATTHASSGGVIVNPDFMQLASVSVSIVVLVKLGSLAIALASTQTWCANACTPSTAPRHFIELTGASTSASGTPL